jgi:hypothetical protein
MNDLKVILVMLRQPNMKDPDEMQKRFGDFKGKIGFPRSSPRWVVDTHIDNATQYVKSLK